MASTISGQFSALRAQRAFMHDVRRARSVFQKELGLKPGASVQLLVDAVAERNRRPITVIELDLAPDLSGMCLRGPAGDRIIVGRDQSEWQRVRVLAHELGHTLCGLLFTEANKEEVTIGGHGHGHGIALRPQALASQLTSLPPDVVQDVLHPSQPPKLRAAYETDEERAVEAWGTVVPTLLSLDGANSPSGAITSAFANRSPL